MQLGSHFGKRKPRWNFFLERQHLIKQRYGQMLRFALTGLILQALISLPLLYWSLQNYNFFENNIPASYNLKAYLTSEKNWVVFLYFFSLVLTAAVNFSLFGKAFSKPNGRVILPDEAEDQRHAS